MTKFYMLRLIASDPNTEVVVERKRGSGYYKDVLQYDFPVGQVVGRFSDLLDLDSFAGKLPIDILVIRLTNPFRTIQLTLNGEKMVYFLLMRMMQ